MSLIEIIHFSGTEEALKNTEETILNSGDLKKINEEKGCCYFNFYYTPDHKELILLEKWESEEALDAHHQTEMMKNLLALIKKHDLKFSVEKYNI